MTACCGFGHRDVFFYYTTTSSYPLNWLTFSQRPPSKYRNRWMIDHSDIVLIYTKRNYGGAYESRRYAEKIGKEIVYISGK